MGTISDAVYIYDENDEFSPVETLLNLQSAAVQSKFDEIGPGSIRYVANTAARNALASSFAPSATKPLYVYRGDAVAGRNLEFTLDGTNWLHISDSRDEQAMLRKYTQSGIASISVSNLGAWSVGTNQSVTFPTPFSTAPRVSVQRTGSNQPVQTALWGVSTTGFSITPYNSSPAALPASLSISYHWIATTL